MATEVKKLVAQRFDQKARTADVIIDEEATFASLLLHPSVQQGLTLAGFVRPSPIQIKAIPLGRCGCDLIVQAKSGTGKTCVFAVIALESIDLESDCTQVVVLAPTREIAVQVWEVIKSLGVEMTKLHCYVFIGGLPLAEDRQKLKHCHIAVATPGRFKQLIEMEAINVNNVRLFVLDEADKLLEQGFQDDVNWIYSSLPKNKQMLALSATFPESLAQQLKKYMRAPFMIRLNTCDRALLGISQYFKVLPFLRQPFKMREEKTTFLLKLLSSVDFQQCLIFSNSQFSAEDLMNRLNSEKWPSAYICGSMAQEQRLKVMSRFRSGRIRVLISTDLTSRGVDVENVNLVINFDLPADHETYLHRNGRAGRFGSFGAAVTLISENEMAEFLEIERLCQTTVHPLLDPIPGDLASRAMEFPGTNSVTVERFSQDLSSGSDQVADALASEKPISDINASGDREHQSNIFSSGGVANTLVKVEGTSYGCLKGDSVSLNQICTTDTETGLECKERPKSKELVNGTDNGNHETTRPKIITFDSEGRPNLEFLQPCQTPSQKPAASQVCKVKERLPEMPVSLDSIICDYMNFASMPELQAIGLDDVLEGLEISADIDIELGDESFTLQINELTEHSGKTYAAQFPNCARLMKSIQELCEDTSCGNTEVSCLFKGSAPAAVPLVELSEDAAPAAVPLVELPADSAPDSVPLEELSGGNALLENLASESPLDMKLTISPESAAKISATKRISWTREQLRDMGKQSANVAIPSHWVAVVESLNIKRGTVYATNDTWDNNKRGSGRMRYGGGKNANTNNNFKWKNTNRQQYGNSPVPNTDAGTASPGISRHSDPVDSGTGAISPVPSLQSDHSCSSKATSLFNSEDHSVSFASDKHKISEPEKTEASTALSETTEGPPFTVLCPLSDYPVREQYTPSPQLKTFEMLPRDQPAHFIPESQIVIEDSVFCDVKKSVDSMHDSGYTELKTADSILPVPQVCKGQIQIAATPCENRIENYSGTTIDLNSVDLEFGQDASRLSSGFVNNRITHFLPTEDSQESSQIVNDWNHKIIYRSSDSTPSEAVRSASLLQNFPFGDVCEQFKEKCILNVEPPTEPSKSTCNRLFSEYVDSAYADNTRSEMFNGLYWKPSENHGSLKGKPVDIKHANAKITMPKERLECSPHSLKGEKNPVHDKQKSKLDTRYVDSASRQYEPQATAENFDHFHQPPFPAKADSYSSYCWNSYVSHMQQAEHFRQLYTQYQEQTRLQNIAVQQWYYINHMVKCQRKC